MKTFKALKALKAFKALKGAYLERLPQNLGLPSATPAQKNKYFSIRYCASILSKPRWN